MCKLFKRIFKGSAYTFITMFIWECCEELLEELIAYAIASATELFILKVVSTFTIVTTIKNFRKILKRFIILFTYKGGNDKMKKFKNILQALKSNKCSIGLIIITAISVLTGTEVIDIQNLPEIIVGGENISQTLYYIVLGIGTLICGVFFEKTDTYNERIKKSEEQKSLKKKEREEQKEIAKAERQKAEDEAEAERIIADMKAKEIAEAEEKVKSARIDEIVKRKLEEEKNNNVNCEKQV